MREFELEVVSHHPQFKEKVLRPYFVDGIDTIGVWGEEPFELRFRNRTNKKLQVRLSVDGTDVLTGSVADVTSAGRMWVVEAHDTLALKAWPETNEKGARFVFGQTANSVAANTHGDLSAKGIIGAAVFVEGYVPPPRYYGGDFYFQGGSFNSSIGGSYGGGGSYGSYGGGRGMSAGGDARIGRRSKSLERLDIVDCCEPAPAVGAGETVKQAIGSASGLVQPRLERVVSMRYLWWDELKAKLDAMTAFGTRHPTGFKGHSEQKMIDLGRTPRMDRVRHDVVIAEASRVL